jgi:hypothetical protein
VNICVLNEKKKDFSIVPTTHCCLSSPFGQIYSKRFGYGPGYRLGAAPRNFDLVCLGKTSSILVVTLGDRLEKD